MNYSFLDLVYVKENQTVQQAFNELKTTSQKADALGFTRYWLAEHHNMEGVASNATSVLMGYVAANTQKIRVGSGGVMLPNHSPLAISEQFGTLAQIYPNRIDLGLGRAPGTDGLTAQHMNESFMKNVHEFPKNVSAIQQYISAENTEAKVRAYVAEGTNIPIYILGSSTDSAVLAAAYGLPYAFASHFAPQQLGAAFKFYTDEFQPNSGIASPYKIACVNVIIGETNEEAKLQASTFYKMFLGLIRNQRSKMKQPDLNFYNDWSVVEEAQLSQMTAGSFIGDKETVARNLQQFIDRYKIDEIMMSCPIYSVEKRLYSMEQFASIISKI
ncbi:LLM class flavin-dependent oxidoreductase [Paenimyroides aestuarii]|uniref:LLM class flavin-dependent oxidoreductase n=1 Tax=Paenimyroides aestuarii TaxID=2968490 RepID=A0ABY5NP65_9FLAO|nr:LLM class flavin-dependent oxidoreductase [Paenimyroides aestuarii]UUV20346.1 LLM class flavin-dependent oxidoreductase [Paenimyroides aestuarii]